MGISSIFSDGLETFTELPSLPNCAHLERGRKLLKEIQERNSPGQKAWLTFIIRGLSLPPGGKVLEIGAGCCDYARELCLRGFEYHGYDMTEQSVALWRILKEQYGLTGNVAVQDICAVDCTDKENYFDGIVAVHTFEHIHDQSKALDNCYRLLKRGGRLVIIDGNFLDPRMTLHMLPLKRGGGFRWLFNKGKVYDDYDSGWKGKSEDVKTVFWWKRHLKRHGFAIDTLATSSARKWFLRLSGMWPFCGGVWAVGRKP